MKPSEAGRRARCTGSGLGHVGLAVALLFCVLCWAAVQPLTISEGKDVGLPCLGLCLDLPPGIKPEKRKERPGGPTGNEFKGEVWPELRLILQMPSHRVGQRGCPLGAWPVFRAAALPSPMLSLPGPAAGTPRPSLRLWVGYSLSLFLTRDTWKPPKFTQVLSGHILRSISLRCQVNFKTRTEGKPGSFLFF